MKNGEGTEEKLSSVVTSPCDPVGHELWQGHKSYDEDELSEYSSCDGESEFERYCSANSSMGTPTVRSSLGPFHEFPGSFKLGDENNKVKNLVGWRKLTDFSEPGPSIRGSECSYVKGEPQGLMGIGKGLDLYGNAEDLDSFKDEGSFLGNVGMGEEWNGKANELQNMRSDFSGKLFIKTNSYESSRYKNSELIEKEAESLGISDHSLEIKPMVIEDGADSIRNIGNFEGSSLHYGVATGGAEPGRCSDESGASSNYEHSDSEGSMFGGNTDDEKKFNSYYRREVQCSLEEKQKNENYLVMNSATAFGADDWDDFMQENAEFTPTSMARDELQAEDWPSIKSENGCLSSAMTVTAELTRVGLAIPKEEEKDILLPSNHNQAGDELTNNSTNCSMDPLDLLNHGKGKHAENKNSMLNTNNQIEDINESESFPEPSTIHNWLKLDSSTRIQPVEAPLKEVLRIGEDDLELKHHDTSANEIIYFHDDLVTEKVELKNTSLLSDPLSHPVLVKHHLSIEQSKDVKLTLVVDQGSSPSVANDATMTKKTIMKSSSLPVNCFENHPTSTETQKHELNELYDELVHDMEEILLESGESHGFTLGNKIYQSYIPLPSRDGGSTASISGSDDPCSVVQHPLRFDRVEVIGARQKEGDVSLSERLVGVRKYTVYRIRVWSGENYWVVERRYRDFCALYRRLKKSFADQGWILLPVWSSIERESRKIFGSSSPDVVAERSVLIQECLSSLLHSRFPTGALTALVCFLSPSKDLPASPNSDTNIPQSPFLLRSTSRGDVSSLGKKISLVVHKRPHKSNKQLLDEQHFSCAGCYKNFDDGKTRMQELAQTLGWGKPRLCEYSGQLYCSSCHTNDMAILPARILHFWDFNHYPVSQLAKSYLDSIHNQPMLCVSAVNPLLFSKVPALQHVTNIRKKIETMLPFVRCPFRRSIYKGVGSRRYLLESNDFFAIRDLIDLSKGVFSALPVMVETISRKILEHISEQCLICCDVGIPCNARQACDDPSSLIFPFQEGEIERCKSCQSVFHKLCFKRVASCHCGTRLKPEQEGNTSRDSQKSSSSSSMGDFSLDLLGKRSDLSKRLFSGLFSNLRSPKSRESGEQRPEDRNTVIVMGSLPMTTL